MKKKSCCIRIGPRWDVRRRSIKTSNGHIIPWLTEFRYLGTYIVGSRTFKCSTTHAKRSFHRAINAIFENIGRLASEEVILVPWAGKKQMCAMFVVWTRMLYFAKKFFEIVILCCRMILSYVNNEIIRECCSYFKFLLPSELLDRRVKFQNNFMLCTSILHYFVIKI